MSPNQPHQPDDAPGGPRLFEFVDPDHDVTEEERNRPRYGMPPRRPWQPGPPKPDDTASGDTH